MEENQVPTPPETPPTPPYTPPPYTPPQYAPPQAPQYAPPAGQGGRPAPTSDTSKLLAAGGYIIWIVALIAILIEPYKNEPFVKFHAYQALGFSLGVFVLGLVIGFIPFVQIISLLIWPAWLILAIIWAVKAYNGEYAEMPLVYGFVKNYIGE